MRGPPSVATSQSGVAPVLSWVCRYHTNIADGKILAKICSRLKAAGYVHQSGLVHLLHVVCFDVFPLSTEMWSAPMECR